MPAVRLWRGLFSVVYRLRFLHQLLVFDPNITFFPLPCCLLYAAGLPLLRTPPASLVVWFCCLHLSFLTMRVLYLPDLCVVVGVG
jgi:hypothetical protein